MFTVKFENGYGEELQPIDADTKTEAFEIAETLKKRHYSNIQVVDEHGLDVNSYASKVLAKRYSISEMSARFGESAYLMASEKARAEMCKECGVEHYTYRQVFDYAMEQEFLFDFHGYLKNR